MTIRIFEDDAALAADVAQEMVKLVQEKPDAVFCLATGESPMRTYAAMVQLAKEKDVDFSSVNFIGLDEWVGIPRSNPGSCYHFLHERIFQPLGIQESQIYLFDGMAADLQSQCTRMNDHIAQLGGIDWMLVGIGMNGHIGFNEPGISWDKRVHVADLAPITQTVGQKYFQSEMVLKQGLTMGVQHILEARTVALLANGVRKAAIIQSVLEGEVSNLLPASVLQQHANALVFLDREAASGLKNSCFFTT